MAAVKASVQMAVGSTISKTIFGNAQNIDATFGDIVTLAAGSGAAQFNQRYAATRVLTSGAADVMDLTDGSLKQDDGTSFVAVDVVVIGFKANPNNTDNIVIGSGTGAMSSILNATGTITLPPGAVFIVKNVVAASGYSVSNHKIQVTTPGSASYDVLILSH